MLDSDFFQVEHPLKINLEALTSEQVPVSQEDFELSIPDVFLAQQVSLVNSPQLFAQLHTLGEAGEAIYSLLQHQQQQLDQLRQYILQQQDQSEQRSYCTHFGGSGLRCIWPEAVALGSMHRLKIFLPSEHTAIYCIAEVTNCHKNDKADSFLLEISYHWVRNSDIELLVRASLHIQTQQLKVRSQTRS